MDSAVSRIRVRPTRQGLYYLALTIGIFLAACSRQVNILLLIAGFAAGPWLFGWWMAWNNLRGLRVRRHLPRRVCAGDLLVGYFEIANRRGRRPRWSIRIEDTVRMVAPQDRGAGVAPAAVVSLARVTSGPQPHSESFQGRLTARGRYEWGPLRISTRFPFGLFEASRTIETRDSLVAYPRLGRLTRRWRERAHLDYEGRSRREMCHHRMSGDFFGLREWRSGDNPRFIHWRSSARHQELLVKEFDQPHNEDVTLLLALWSSKCPTVEDHHRVEEAISFVATVLDDICRKGGANTRLVISGEETISLAGPASPGLLDQALESLAVAVPTCQDPRPALQAAVRRLPSTPGAVILVTTYPAATANGHGGNGWSSIAPGRSVRVFDVSAGGLRDYFYCSPSEESAAPTQDSPSSYPGSEPKPAPRVTGSNAQRAGSEPPNRA